MTVIQEGMFGSPAYYCERCGRSLSNPISMAFHKGPVCREKTGVKEMSKDKQIDMRKWGRRFDYKGYGGCTCHCYIKVNGNTVICTEAPDNEGTSITNLAEQVAEQVSTAYHIPFDQLVWIEHYLHEDHSAIDETFDLVTFDYSRDAYHGSHFTNPQWSPMDKTDKDLLDMVTP